MDAELGLATRLVWCLMFGSLAWLFGRGLRPGQVALITAIARVDKPALPENLVRYTRRLTAVWSSYFVLAAVAAALWNPVGWWLGPGVGAGSVLLFVFEHRVRRYLFPQHNFPGLIQQLRDTARVWRDPP
ncbi:hypothetical protein [Ottowia sp.]|uniref:hypothetical protein n=1 Tax=Ottowia sp. TaxID=1898956 RepID=UPI002BAF5D62|nr:hypothetical protein [Ottowia sp.]HRN77128.1 hypothetical protein [Ottowia sp.]